MSEGRKVGWSWVRGWREGKQVGRVEVVEEELSSRKAEFILSEKKSAYRSRTYIHVRKTLRIVGMLDYHGISLQKGEKGEQGEASRSRREPMNRGLLLPPFATRVGSKTCVW